MTLNHPQRPYPVPESTFSYIDPSAPSTRLNYLSHYFCEYPDQRPYFVLGLILPDLVRELEPRKIRFVPEELQTALDQRGHDLNEGIIRHLQVDEMFHQSNFFHEKVAQIKDWLLRYEYETIPSRIPVFAHVLLELMIDRVLILRDPRPMEDFYTLLEQVEEEALAHYFEQNGLVQQPSAVYRRVRYFCKDRFLYRYTDNAMMLYALNVLNQKVGQPVISEQDEALLLDTIERTESMLQSDELTIFKQLRLHA